VSLRGAVIEFEGFKECYLRNSSNNMPLDLYTTNCGRFIFPVLAPENFNFIGNFDSEPLENLKNKDYTVKCTHGICDIQIPLIKALKSNTYR
jgi:hypothetical protein